MREKILTNSELSFVTSSLKDNLRIGKRGVLDIRELNIKSNSHNGSCIVTLGETRIISQITSEIVKPKDARPNEGLLKINLETSPNVFLNTDITKQNEYIIELNRLIERNIMQSHVLDLESLCLRTGEKVWLIRVNLNILNNDGNILDCANVAVISALYNYRLPETVIFDSQVISYSEKERKPNPLTIIHIPLTISFGYFNDGNNTIIDPDELEERCMDGKIIIGINKHLELSMIELNGAISISKNEVMRCVEIASTKIRKITDYIEQELKKI